MLNKQLLRFLIKDVTLTALKSSIDLQIRWQTEAITPRPVARRPKSYEIRRTSPIVVERVRSLAADRSDKQIAATLKQEGFAPSLGETFTARKVHWIRFSYQITTAYPSAPSGCPTRQRGDGHYSARVTAELLNVIVSTIATWCETGILDSLQQKPHGPRLIKLTPELINRLHKPNRQRWQKHIPK